MNTVLTYISIFVLSFMLTELIRRQAIKKSILDIPNHRSSHSVPTPRGGGMAIALVWYVAVTILFFKGVVDPPLFLALMSGLVLTVVSFIDDLKNLSPKIRFIAQFISASGALIALKGSHFLDVGFYTFNNPILFSILAIPFIIWFINLFNFLDGIDGYLGMEAILVFVGMWIFTSNALLLVLAFAVFGFLMWNWPMPKAKIFCGDVGSTLIGFNFAVFTLYFQNTQQLSVFIPLILSSLFWFDATLTLFRRWKNKEKLSEAHRKHSYQRIVQYGFSHAKTVYWAAAINLLFWVISFIVYKNPNLLLAGFVIVLLILWRILKYVDDRKPFV